MKPSTIFIVLTSSLASTVTAGKFNPAATFATWTKDSCWNGQQTDHNVPDGFCNHLPGQGLTLWWLAPGCSVRVFEKEGCQGASNNWSELQQCYNIHSRNSYQIYC